MSELSKTIDCLKEKTHDTFEYYCKKENWEPSDLKCVKEAAEIYSMLQGIQMDTGVWENMKRTGDYSFARYPRISYGNESYTRARSMGHGDMYYDDRRLSGYDHASYGDGGHYHDGRSMHSVKDQAIQRLEALMDLAKSDYEREEIHKMIKKIEETER